MTIITAYTLRFLDICERRVWLDANGDPTQRDEITPFVAQLFAGGIEHEQTVRRPDHFHAPATEYAGERQFR